MTRDETKDLLAVIQAAYPTFHRAPAGKEKSDAEWTAIINIWAIAMSDFPYGFIANGFKRLVQNNKFPPSPAEVIEAAKSSALDWCAATDPYLPRGAISPDAWLYIGKRPIQYAQFSEECRQLQEATDAQDRRNALSPRNEPRQ